MLETPKSMRLQIGLFGRTNVGKSSFLNMIAGQDIAVTSSIPGTTTDIVEKAMELLPIGPMMFLDTAGTDDTSELSAARLKKTASIFDRADVFVLVVENAVWTEFEDKIINEAKKRNAPLMVVVNKSDLNAPSTEFLQNIKTKVPQVICCSSTNKVLRDQYVTEFKETLIKILPDEQSGALSIIGDKLKPCGIAVLVVPIDKEAPKGRLILPQVQTIRDLLDNDAVAIVVKEQEYAQLLNNLKCKPDIVICDSQVVDKVVADTPSDIPCTTFSILFARFKGDLVEEVKGAAVIEKLKDGDKVLIAEACSHHPVQDDIGRVKIPRWLRKFTGANLEIDVCCGRDYPPNLSEYKLIIHCGACMLTRREMISRIRIANGQNVPITNYGVAISLLQGVLQRALAPFGDALDAYREISGK